MADGGGLLFNAERGGGLCIAHAVEMAEKDDLPIVLRQGGDGIAQKGVTFVAIDARSRRGDGGGKRIDP